MNIETIEIRQAESARARVLFAEYAAWLAAAGVELALQGFAAEMAGLPGGVWVQA